MKVYVLINERGPGIETCYEVDKVLFQERNKAGWGVYFAVNDFEATDEEMKEAGVKTKRNIQFLKKINHVFADLDIAKKGDGKTREEKEKLKELLLFDLYDICPPTAVIYTSNGVQPLFRVHGLGIDAESQRRYVNVINAIIEWSKGHGAAGDKVKDVTRILRMPGYFHMKEEPYLCELKHEDSLNEYTIGDLEKIFLPYLPVDKPVVSNFLGVKRDKLSLAIDSLDIHDVAVRAFASIGRRCEFDKQDRIVLDGRLTGGFKSDQGNFIATTSHEPFDGNVITLPAKIKTLTNKEAREWLVEEFGLKKDTHQIKKSVNERPRAKYSVDEDVKVFTWGTPGLDRAITPMAGGQLNLITGFTNMGKTTYAFDVAQKNAKMGHKVLYFTLEQNFQQQVDRLAREYAGINKHDWLHRPTISESKKMRFRMKVDEINSMKNLVLYGFGDGVEPTPENIFEVVRQIRPDLVFIDNFDDIAKGDKNEYLEQNTTIRRLKDFAQEVMLPINVTHHRNAKSKQQGGGAVRGSGKITDTAFTSLKCSREWEADASPKDNATFTVQHEKDRDFGSLSFAVVYWQNGTFNDDFNS